MGLSVSQVFSPEVDMGSVFTSGTYIKKYVPATSSSIAFTYNLNQRLGVQVAGFYQTALANYFDPNGDYRKKPIYRPYSFGLNAGLLFY